MLLLRGCVQDGRNSERRPLGAVERWTPAGVRAAYALYPDSHADMRLLCLGSGAVEPLLRIVTDRAQKDREVLWSAWVALSELGDDRVWREMVAAVRDRRITEQDLVCLAEHSLPVVSRDAFVKRGGSEWLARQLAAKPWHSLVLEMLDETMAAGDDSRLYWVASLWLNYWYDRGAPRS